MAILDNRTRLSGFEAADTPAAPDNLTGAAVTTLDDEIFIEGVRSYGWYTTTTRDGLLYDAGSAQDWSGNTFYFWVNCGVVGLLDTLANGGMAARFCGATVTDWFEVNLAGSNSYPAAIKGGWVMFVVDVEKAKTASNRTNGTPPATTAIRYAGITTITSATMPRMVSNTWLDCVWRLPASTPGILVEGINTTPDWTWADIAAAADTGAWGTARVAAGGAIAINTPIRFGANDAVTHGFTDSNAVVLWEDWDVATGFYGLQVIGGSGVQRFALGVKTGTGDAATGSQGGVIAAAGAGQRWYFDADDANVDACNVYGAALIHTSDLQIDSAVVSFISTTIVDGSSATLTNIGDFLRCQVVDANTADGVAWGVTDDLSDIVFSTFFFSDGHAIELTTPNTSTQASKGNIFNGYGAIGTNDAAIYNNSGAGLVTVNVSDLGGTPTYRNGTSATTTVQNTVTLLVTCTYLGNARSDVRVRIETTGGTLIADGTTNGAGVFSAAYNYTGDTAVNVIVRLKKYRFQSIGSTITTSGLTIPVALAVNAAVNLP